MSSWPRRIANKTQLSSPLIWFSASYLASFLSTTRYMTLHPLPFLLLVFPDFTVCVCFLKIQEANPRSGLLQSAVVTLYCTYLIWSGIMAEPDSWQCKGPLNGNGGDSTASAFVGVAITFLAVMYSAFSVSGSANEMLVSQVEKDSVRGSQRPNPLVFRATKTMMLSKPPRFYNRRMRRMLLLPRDLLLPQSQLRLELPTRQRKKAKRQSWSQRMWTLRTTTRRKILMMNRLIPFTIIHISILPMHWQQCTFACFWLIGKLFRATRLCTPKSKSLSLGLCWGHFDLILIVSSRGVVVDYGPASVWVKIVSSWLVSLIYFWTLLAPCLCPDRFRYQG